MIKYQKILFFTALLSFLFISTEYVSAYCPDDINAEIISIKNSPDCIFYSINTSCVTAELHIENNCHQPFFILFNENGKDEPRFKIINEQIEGVANKPIRKYFSNRNSDEVPNSPYHSYTGFVDNSISYRKINSTEKEYNWVVKGKLGDNDIEIYGRSYIKEKKSFWQALFNFFKSIFFTEQKDEIKNIDSKKGYKDWIKIVDQVSENKKIDECASIQDVGIKKVCTTLGSKDFNSCKEVSEQGTRDWCYKNAALIAKDSSFCFQIQDIDIKNICFYKLAFETNDIKICSNISYYHRDYDSIIGLHNYIFGREACYSHLATLNKKSEYCECLETDFDYCECKNIWVELSKGNPPTRRNCNDQNSELTSERMIPQFCSE